MATPPLLPGFEAQSYNPEWPNEIPDVLKLAQYFAFDRMSRVEHFVSSYGIGKIHLSRRRVQSTKKNPVKVDYTVISDRRKNCVAKGVDTTSKKFVERLDRKNAPERRGLHPALEVALYGKDHADFERDEGDDIKITVYPKHHITVYQAPRTDKTLVERARFRLHTNQQAMWTYHGILLGTLELNQLPAGEKTKKNQRDRRLEDDPDIRHWADVTEEILTPNYRKVVVSHTYDDTVTAFFRKPDDQPWEVISVETFKSSSIPTRKRKETKYRLWIEKRSKKLSSFRKGGGTVYIQQADTGASYYVVDTEDAPRTNDPAAPLRNAFLGIVGTWKMVQAMPPSDATNDTQRRRAAVWVLLSEENEIEARVVTRCFHPSQSGLGLEALTDAFNEANCHYDRLLLARDNFLLKSTGASVRTQDNIALADRFTTFLEYCAAGDLGSLVRSLSQEDRKLPETFIWVLFQNLVKACQTIQGRGLIHPRITLDSIFLNSKPLQGRWIAFVSPVLGHLDYFEPVNDVSGRGKLGFYTPEHLQAQRERRLAESELRRPRPTGGSKLHVYAIGICIWSVMRGQAQGLNPIIQNCEAREPPRGSTISTYPNSHFSVILEKLLRDCLNYDPARRPSLESLSDAIESAIESFNKIKPRFDTRSEDEMPESDKFLVREDQFIVGTQLPAARRRRGSVESE